jgi:hypothetical protein
MVTQVIGTAAAATSGFSAYGAKSLGSDGRKDLAIQVLARTAAVTELADRHKVSRKFLYEQARRASAALDDRFNPTEKEEEVLFHLPVTKGWIRQFVLGLALEGHSSFRGIGQLAQDLLDYPLSVGTIHNILEAAASQARVINQAQDLLGIRVGAHDEIYQAGRPVLVGLDAKSTYCYLLAEEDHCDETTWGVHLLDLADQGLHPDRTVADGGLALRAGQAAAWKDVPCHGDVFHGERDLGNLAFYLERRACGCTSARQKLEHQMQRRKQKGRGNELSKKLAIARQAETQAVALAQDVRVLADWLQKDILSLSGPSLATRRELFNFVVAELAAREGLCSHRIGPVRRTLESQRDNLLGFAQVLEEEFADLSEQFQVPIALVQQLCQQEALDAASPAYWRQRGPLVARLGAKFQPLQQAVRGAMEDVTRASSLVENLNSRLRTYFFLRRDLGTGYLDLLRFFLNHRRFPRSRRSERVGRSPAELLNGRTLPHWLDLLGFQRFHRPSSPAAQN